MVRELFIHYYNDGEEISTDIIHKLNISDLFRITNQKATVNFVGVVIAKNNILVSFPKYFDHSHLEEVEKNHYIKLISTLLIKGKSSFSSKYDNNTEESKFSKEFPIDSYITIRNYYKKYGIYNKKTKIETKNGSGKLNWGKTIRKSSKIIQDNGIVFLPIITSKNITRSVFIGQCMEFILADVFSKYSKVLYFTVPFQKGPSDGIFKNFKACARKLKLIKNQYFKDSEKELIQAMIEYFEWLSDRQGTLVITTNNFNNYWETMVHLYLNKRFCGVSNDKIEWGENLRFKFYKYKEFVEPEENQQYSNTRKFSIEFDHISYNLDEKQIFLFDSKYVNHELDRLNYKQAFYYYFLNAKYPDTAIYNGLMAPTSKHEYMKIHVDRTVNHEIVEENIKGLENSSEGYAEGYADGLKIVEYYLNLKDLLHFTLDNLNEFKIEFRKTI